MSTPSSSSSPPRRRTHEEEEILVLYGSQTGNSESTAKEISSLLPTKLNNIKFLLSECCDDDGTEHPLQKNNILLIKSRVMSLDDFLEIHKAKWTRIVIIVVSSYGVGQAPLGARRFREVCDEVLERYGYDVDDITGKKDASLAIMKSTTVTTEDSSSLQQQSNGQEQCQQGDQQLDTPHPTPNKPHKSRKPLEGIQFALLGLGDSHYTTFFRNPTIIHEALTTWGATRIGSLGKADASGTGDMEQSKVIDRWIEGIWREIAVAVAKDPPEQMDGILDQARKETWELCLDLFEEWRPTNYVGLGMVMLPLGAVIVGIIVQLILYGWVRE